jgi:uncharacterized protein
MLSEQTPAPRIHSLLIKPVSALCNLDCAYCFYLDREADPYGGLPDRRMSVETLERLVDGYLFYSFPHSMFAFQGGEPTLAGLPFFQKVLEFQRGYARPGQTISNTLQTNGILLDEDWCRLFREGNWLIGVSLDGWQEVHDCYRTNRAGKGSWERVIEAIRLLRRHQVEFNILCVLSQANVEKPKELYRFYRGLGVDNMQFIPLAEFAPDGRPAPFTISAAQYGTFLTELFDAWWPDRRKVRIRIFDNLAEALAGQGPGNCTMLTTCDSYAVVEYNGDVFPCDFFVNGEWKLGNIHLDSWPEIARRRKRVQFAAKKAIGHPDCQACDYQAICYGGCPKFRHGQRRDFSDLDYFCGAYKMIFAKAVTPLLADVNRILGR